MYMYIYIYIYIYIDAPAARARDGVMLICLMLPINVKQIDYALSVFVTVCLPYLLLLQFACFGYPNKQFDILFWVS